MYPKSTSGIWQLVGHARVEFTVVALLRNSVTMDAYWEPGII